MATDRVQITAVVPVGLKKVAFARFAQADTTFSRWLREELRKFTDSAPEPPKQPLREAQHAARC